MWFFSCPGIGPKTGEHLGRLIILLKGKRKKNHYLGTTVMAKAKRQ